MYISDSDNESIDHELEFNAIDLNNNENNPQVYK